VGGVNERSHNKTYSWGCCSLKYVIYLDFMNKNAAEKEREWKRKIENYISMYESISFLG
jgi:hypothetical protein